MSDVPVDAPEACPGTKSETAGKVSACQGCPNQSLCASGEANKPDPDLPAIAKNLKDIQRVILVLSGKGGVGKSSVTAGLAYSLAKKGLSVGVLDIDICGPSLPNIFGVQNEQVHQSGSGWSPVFADDNICLMSVGFLLPSLDDAVIWRGPKKNGMIKQFLKDVDWGDVNILLIDTPPGTSDEHLSIVQCLPKIIKTGAIVVTTPQEIALLDVRKEISFCRRVDLPILGVVENMSDFICPKCKFQTKVFPPTTGGAEGMCKEFNLPLLSAITLDKSVGQCCDEGKNFIELFPESPVTASFARILLGIEEFLSK